MKNFNGLNIPENLSEIVNPSHSCLVVWDVQNALIKRIYNKDTYLEKLAPVVEKLRSKMPVFYTLITPLPQPFQSAWGLYSMMRRYGVSDPSKIPPFMAPGTDDREIPSAVKPGPKDIAFEKSTPNIFLGTNFEAMLRNKGISTILFTGIATEMGVELSARDAAARGFFPVVISDCVSSMDQAAHDRGLTNMARMLIVEDSSAVLKAVGL